MTVRRAAGQWADMDVAELPLGLHPWNHAPRELPRATFETMRAWHCERLRAQHASIVDALSGRRLDVKDHCVPIAIKHSELSDSLIDKELRDEVFPEHAASGELPPPSAEELEKEKQARAEAKAAEAAVA